MSYATRHAIGAYRTAAINVPPPTAVTLLLDEVLNTIALAAKHSRQSAFEQSFLSIQRASNILRGLRQNVDLDLDREFGQQFVDMYTQNIFALNNASGSRSAAEKFAELASGLLEFRNAWAEMTTLAPRVLDTLIADILDQRAVVDVV